MASSHQKFQSILTFNEKTYRYFDLVKFSQQTKKNLDRLPYSIRVLLEGCLRNAGKKGFSEEHARAIIEWEAAPGSSRMAIPFLPARVLMQDFTGHFPGEGGPTGEHRVHDGTQRIQVTMLGGALPPGLFRRHIFRGSHYSAGSCQPRCGKHMSHAEVG